MSEAVSQQPFTSEVRIRYSRPVRMGFTVNKVALG